MRQDYMWIRVQTPSSWLLETGHEFPEKHQAARERIRVLLHVTQAPS